MDDSNIATSTTAIRYKVKRLPGNFEDPEKSGTSENGDTEWREYFGILEYLLHDGEDYDKAIVSVKQGQKVFTEPHTVHL